MKTAGQTKYATSMLTFLLNVWPRNAFTAVTVKESLNVCRDAAKYDIKPTNLLLIINLSTEMIY